jgi:hypothetical protein
MAGKGRADGYPVDTGFDREALSSTASRIITPPSNCIEWTIRNASTGGLDLRLGSTQALAEGTRYFTLQQGESLTLEGDQTFAVHCPAGATGAFEIALSALGAYDDTTVIGAEV